MKTLIYIDGEHGTTGLQIKDRLKKRDDIELLSVPHEKRKDLEVRKNYLIRSDISILCLPDEAAVELVKAIDDNQRIIDASSAHRTADKWVYGFPELHSQQRDKIAEATRVANPGCYATGFIALVAPLIQRKLLDPNAPLTCNGLSGYTGGGKKLIADYERSVHFYFYSPYALGLDHKHLNEMRYVCGLKHAPLFVPAVDHFPQGMLVQVPLPAGLLEQNKCSAKDIEEALQDHYNADKLVRVGKLEINNLRDGKFLDIPDVAGKNHLDIYISSNANGDCLLMAKLDNLGKGASGAAVQNLNLMMGCEETKGL